MNKNIAFYWHFKHTLYILLNLFDSVNSKIKGSRNRRTLQFFLLKKLKIKEKLKRIKYSILEEISYSRKMSTRKKNSNLFSRFHPYAFINYFKNVRFHIKRDHVLFLVVCFMLLWRLSYVTYCFFNTSWPDLKVLFLNTHRKLQYWCFIEIIVWKKIMNCVIVTFLKMTILLVFDDLCIKIKNKWESSNNACMELSRIKIKSINSKKIYN